MGRRVAAAFRIPDQFPGAAPWRSLICLSAVSIEDWSGRLFFVNPAQPVSDDQQLRFLQTTWQQVRPALVNIDLLRRLRSRLDEVNAAWPEAVTEKIRLETVTDDYQLGWLFRRRGGASGRMPRSVDLGRWTPDH
jgi:hypothetical protein